MWKLTIEDDDGQRTSLELGQQEYSIGRSEDSVIRLTERNVSRNHAVVRNAGEGWQIEDVGSYNGTYINGERVVDSKPFNSGDVVQLGDYRIELLDAAALAAQEAEETRRRRPDRLVMVIGPAPGSEFALVGDLLTIGRAEEASVSVNHASVSRLHADLVRVGESRWEVIDKGSSNGIRINGMELRRGMIEAGDALELGDVRLRFVAAGKYFRPSSTLGAHLAGVPPFEAAASGAASAAGSRRSIGTILAVAAVVGVLIVGLVVLVASGSGGGPDAASSAEPMATSEAEARELLDKAKERVKDDVMEAHKMVMRIPESSPLREGEDFRAIEDAWANAMFKKVEATEDDKEKLELLYAISDATTVSTENRRKALEMADAIDPNPKRPRPKLQPATQPQAGPVNNGGALQPRPPSPPSPPSPASPKPPPGGVKFDEQAQKNALYQKALQGRASEGELRMLKGICMNQGDRACRSLAVQRLKELRNK